MTNLVSSHRPKRFGRAHKNFLKKVEVLESWAEEGGVPDGHTVPNGPVALAKWKDESLGFGSWSSPNIASPTGPYPDLRSRFDRAASILNPQAEKEEAASNKAVIDEQKSVILSLVEQNTELMEKNVLLEEELERTKQQVNIFMERERKATQRLSVVRPIGGNDS